MSCIKFKVKVGDLEPAIEDNARNSDGAVIVLPATATATFRYERVGVAGSEVGPNAATVVDYTTGLLRYSFQAGDNAVAGVYRGEFIVTDAGRDRSIPSCGFVEWEVCDNTLTNVN